MEKGEEEQYIHWGYVEMHIMMKNKTKIVHTNYVVNIAEYW